jgi:hypothetical protein
MYHALPMEGTTLKAFITSLPKSLELPEAIQDTEFKVDVSRVAELSWPFIVYMTSCIWISKQGYSLPSAFIPLTRCPIHQLVTA